MCAALLTDETIVFVEIIESAEVSGMDIDQFGPCNCLRSFVLTISCKSLSARHSAEEKDSDVFARDL